MHCELEAGSRRGVKSAFTMNVQHGPVACCCAPRLATCTMLLWGARRRCFSLPVSVRVWRRGLFGCWRTRLSGGGSSGFASAWRLNLHPTRRDSSLRRRLEWLTSNKAAIRMLAVKAVAVVVPSPQLPLLLLHRARPGGRESELQLQRSTWWLRVQRVAISDQRSSHAGCTLLRRRSRWTLRGMILQDWGSVGVATAFELAPPRSGTPRGECPCHRSHLCGSSQLQLDMQHFAGVIVASRLVGVSLLSTFREAVPARRTRRSILAWLA